MDNELILIQSPNSTDALSRTIELNQEMDEKIKQYIVEAKAPNTIKSYRSDWAHYGVVILDLYRCRPSTKS